MGIQGLHDSTACNRGPSTRECLLLRLSISPKSPVDFVGWNSDPEGNKSQAIPDGFIEPTNDGLVIGVEKELVGARRRNFRIRVQRTYDLPRPLRDLSSFAIAAIIDINAGVRISVREYEPDAGKRPLCRGRMGSFESGPSPTVESSACDSPFVLRTCFAGRNTDVVRFDRAIAMRRRQVDRTFVSPEHNQPIAINTHQATALPNPKLGLVQTPLS